MEKWSYFYLKSNSIFDSEQIPVYKQLMAILVQHEKLSF